MDKPALRVQFPADTEPYALRVQLQLPTDGEERSGYRSGEFQRKQGNTALFNPSRGRIAAPLCLTLGCLGTAGFGLCLLLMVALWLSDLGMLLLLWLALLFFLPLTAVSAAVLLHGRSVRDRNRRARLYWNLLGGRTYISLRELASGSGRNIEYIRRDLQEMIHRGYFPQARLDANRDTLILDLETYRLYLAAQEQAAHRDEQEKGEKQTAGAQEEPQKTETPELSPEVREVLAEGARVVTLIREANDDLPEKEISDKLDRLEAIVKRIFEILTTEPDKLPDIRRFIQYYLPTTCKLVQVYRDLDRESIQTENMVKSKAQILDTLDTINQAFEKLLDGLYADTAMDVASDISVLETLLAQEGLTK